MNDLFTELDVAGVRWTGVLIHTTGKGKSKVCVQCLPGPAFWSHYRKRKNEISLLLRCAGAWMVRLAPGQWEILLGVTSRNRDELARRMGIELSAFDLLGEPVQPVAPLIEQNEPQPF